MASLPVLAQENILIYVGPGAGPKSVANTLRTIKALAHPKYTIKTVTPDELINPTWISNTALLIMPGGADRPYVEKLSGKGNANIKQYVQNGGKYLGICAGAYYSADRIEFAKDDPELEVTGERELKFFPGLVEGPTYAGFDHRDTQQVAGMRAAKILWHTEQPFAQNKEFTIFYNGGGHFVAAENYPSVIILARYGAELPSQPQQPAAIIECAVGKGKAILSGPHFEWHHDSLEGDNKDLLQIKRNLAQQDTDRMNLAEHLLTRLGIAVRNT